MMYIFFDNFISSRIRCNSIERGGYLRILSNKLKRESRAYHRECTLGMHREKA